MSSNESQERQQSNYYSESGQPDVASAVGDTADGDLAHSQGRALGNPLIAQVVGSELERQEWELVRGEAALREAEEEQRLRLADVSTSRSLERGVSEFMP